MALSQPSSLVPLPDLFAHKYTGDTVLEKKLPFEDFCSELESIQHQKLVSQTQFVDKMELGPLLEVMSEVGVQGLKKDTMEAEGFEDILKSGALKHVPPLIQYKFETMEGSPFKVPKTEVYEQVIALYPQLQDSRNCEVCVSVIPLP